MVLPPLPTAIAVAILHHGLDDLRRAAHRTLLWLTMSAAVAGIYAAMVITVTALVPDHHVWWPAAPVAALAALALIPLRDKLQRGVTRVVYGRWHEPHQVTDDGTGLVASGHHGHGLAITRERAEELGGTVTVRDGSPGVTVQARLPAVTTPAQLPSARRCPRDPRPDRR